MAEARLLSDAISKTNPYFVKHYRKVWGSAPTFGSGGRDGSSHFVLDVEPEFMGLPEQLELAAQRLHHLGVYKFLLRPALAEGHVSAQVFPITIEQVDRDSETGAYLFPDQHILAQIRPILAAKAGKPMATLLAEQEARLGSAAIQTHGIGDNTPKLPEGRRDQPTNRRQRMT